MGMKMGLLVTAIGIGLALRAYKKQKQQHALTGGASQGHHGIGGMLPAGLLAAGGLGAAAYSHHNSQTVPPPTNSGMLKDPSAIYQHLVKCVMDKHLETFYPPQGNGVSPSTPNLHQLAGQIAASGALERIARQFDLPDAFALDLVKLALFDIILLVDDSGSMQAGTRLADMRTIVAEVAHISSAFDSNGIEIRFMNSDIQGNNVRNDGDVANVMRVQPTGKTPAGRSLRDKILNPLVVGPARSQQLPKPVLIIIATDGAATDNHQDSLPVVISRAKEELRQSRCGENSVFFSICQVGDDSGAVDFLESLDNDPRIGSYIDVTSSPEIETHQIMKGLDKNIKNAPPQYQNLKSELKNDPHLWTTLFRLKRLLGPVDLYYDSTDESGQKRSLFSSNDPVYKQHWSESPGFMANQGAMQAQRGYQAPQAPPQNLSYQQPPPPTQDTYGAPGYTNNSYAAPNPAYPASDAYGGAPTYSQPATGNYNQQSYSQPSYNQTTQYPPPSDNNYNYQPSNNYGPPPTDYNQQQFSSASGYPAPNATAYNQPYDQQNQYNQYQQPNNQYQQPNNQYSINQPYGNFGSNPGGFAFPQP